ncbi:MAG: NAD(P)H-dependent flavin oxidoreductase, partial [Candidatus Rokuibacteriota bacterium]
MRYETELTRRLGVAYPIIQAPMASASTPKLVAAVSNAGGLGSLGAAMMPPGAIRDAIRAIRQLTDRPFNINLFTHQVPPAEPQKQAALKARVDAYIRALGGDPATLPAPPGLPSITDQIDAVLDERPPVFSFTFGVLGSEVIAEMKRRHIAVFGTATTVEEGKALAAAGVDAVVAQGSEAGGHRGTFMGAVEDALIGTMALVPMMVDAVELPVIAAGGIMDGRGVGAALMLGAQGVQMGTAFLACPENDAVNPVWRDTLLNDASRGTVLSRAYTGRHCRFIRNKYLAEMHPSDAEIPAFPHSMAVVGPLRALAAQQGNP